MNDNAEVTETQTTDTPPAKLAPVQSGASNPFGGRRELSAGAAEGNIAIESERAIAEAQGKLVVAKRFPRDPYRAMEMILDACKRPKLAESAIYAYTRGGENVTGPSIRLAEELARCWTNVEYGLRELSNQPGYSEMEAYAWDLETNTYSAQRFTVRHVRERRQGDKELTGQRDIYEITANMGARRMRARILAILPDDVVDAAVQQCRQTIQGKSDEPLSARIERMRKAFETFGVTTQMLERRLGHKLGDTTVDELPDLQGVFNALRDGAKPSEYFGAAQLAGAATDDDSGDGKAEKPKAAEKPAATEKPAAGGKKAAAKQKQPEADEGAGEAETEAPQQESAKAASQDDAKDLF